MGRISKGKRRRILERDGHVCQHCGNGWGPGLDRELQIDHIVPCSKGGTHDDSNLQVLCARCNRRKLDHIPQEAPEQVVMRWAERVFGHSNCNEYLKLRHIRQLIRNLEISSEFSARNRGGNGVR